MKSYSVISTLVSFVFVIVGCSGVQPATKKDLKELDKKLNKTELCLVSTFAFTGHGKVSHGVFSNGEVTVSSRVKSIQVNNSKVINDAFNRNTVMTTDSCEKFNGSDVDSTEYNASYCSHISLYKLANAACNASIKGENYDFENPGSLNAYQIDFSMINDDIVSGSCYQSCK